MLLVGQDPSVEVTESTTAEFALGCGGDSNETLLIERSERFIRLQQYDRRVYQGCDNDLHNRTIKTVGYTPLSIVLCFFSVRKSVPRSHTFTHLRMRASPEILRFRAGLLD